MGQQHQITYLFISSKSVYIHKLVLFVRVTSGLFCCFRFGAFCVSIWFIHAFNWINIYFIFNWTSRLVFLIRAQYTLLCLGESVKNVWAIWCLCERARARAPVQLRVRIRKPASDCVCFRYCDQKWWVSVSLQLSHSVAFAIFIPTLLLTHQKRYGFKSEQLQWCSAFAMMISILL